MSDAIENIEERLPSTDRRTYSRQPVRTLAYVELDEGNGGIVLNASEGGLSVQAVMSLMEDSLPKMRFQLSQSNNWLETSARVVWASESRKVAGLQFVDLPEEARLHIREWLTDQAAGAESDERHEPDLLPGGSEGRTRGRARYQIVDPADHGTPKSGPIGGGVAETGSTTARPVEPLASPSLAGGDTPTAPLFGQTSILQGDSQRRGNVPPNTRESDRPWNIAGIVALLAIASLAAGWIAGRGTLKGLLDRLGRTASPAKTGATGVAPVPSGAGEAITSIEVVDIHNQRWTIPFNPSAGGYQASAPGQATRVEWPAFDPATAAPKIQSPDAGSDAGLQQPRPPEIAAQSGSGASIPLTSQVPDPHDLAPPAPPPEAQASRPPSTLQRGALIYHVDPVYPDIARDQNIQGTVKLEVTIGITGVVRSVVAVSGPGLLIEAARSAVRQWRYTPSLLDGKPVEAKEDVSVVFRLPSASR